MSKTLFILYLILLALSHLVRWQSPTARPRPNQRTATLKAVKAGEVRGDTIQLAFRDLQPEGHENPPVVLLLHGTPVASETFNAAAPFLAKTCRVILPDLPGFRGSTWNIPDYSVRAHASYLLQLLEQLQIERVHIVGYSMGGGVGLELISQAPQRVQSLCLLSSIGVQELELFGNYQLNHLIHGVQLAGLWLLQEGFPHFGYMDDAYLNVAYARNFYDTDQRPLRKVLQSYGGPALIIHGKDDGLVPVAAAWEHERLLPQSEMRLYESGGHGLIFSEPQEIMQVIDAFVQKAEHGHALTRAQAEAQKVARSLAPFDPNTIPKPHGLTLFVLVLLLAFATLVSEDLTCIGAGLLVAQGTMSFLSATLACLFGIYLGDLLLYLAGRYLREPVLTRAPFTWIIKPEALTQGEQWFEREGAKAILLSRFLPGSRLPTYVAAGLMGASFWKFAFYFLIAAAVWTPLLVGLATLLGSQMMDYLAAYSKYALLTFIIFVLGFWLILKLILPLFSFRGRRLLLSAWRRKTRWEFWPMWMFYPPVILYVLYLAIKHRSLTLFTVTNPGIYASGFIGESKAEILRNLSAADGYVARHVLLESPSFEQRVTEVRRFMSDHKLSFPIVLKPNAGQRGEGVAIIRSDAQLEGYLRQADHAVIAQEYANGHEFGVFYYRYPSQTEGDLYAITDKRFPAVLGNGKSTLEELILKDERAVCMASFYLNKHKERLYEIPKEGETVQLVEIGTHCRGAMFLEGEEVKTPELRAALDHISKKFSGFYFGRYDIRTPSVEDFKQGRNFKIVELNGVTSEATNIYDPSNGLFKAYRVLMNQWRIAFEIAAENRQRGAKPVALRELLRLLRRYEASKL
ncbi:alpha/beta fold hydrolase [candidate division KSB1 bacterium]|nr:alpha/beta fold hydrolase [candidate division KSB1 bacterium]